KNAHKQEKNAQMRAFFKNECTQRLTVENKIPESAISPLVPKTKCNACASVLCRAKWQPRTSRSVPFGGDQKNRENTVVALGVVGSTKMDVAKTRSGEQGSQLIAVKAMVENTDSIDRVKTAIFAVEIRQGNLTAGFEVRA